MVLSECAWWREEIGGGIEWSSSLLSAQQEITIYTEEVGWGEHKSFVGERERGKDNQQQQQQQLHNKINIAQSRCCLLEDILMILSSSSSSSLSSSAQSYYHDTTTIQQIQFTPKDDKWSSSGSKNNEVSGKGFATIKKRLPSCAHNIHATCFVVLPRYLLLNATTKNSSLAETVSDTRKETLITCLLFGRFDK